MFSTAGSVLHSPPMVLVRGPTGTLLCAAVTFDPSTGSGFIGRCDVRYTFGWSDEQFQRNAAVVRFRMNMIMHERRSTGVDPAAGQGVALLRTSWITRRCVASTLARLGDRVTGFNLTGYSDRPRTERQTQPDAPDGSRSGPWVLVDDSRSTTAVPGIWLEVRHGGQWRTLQEAPLLV